MKHKGVKDAWLADMKRKLHKRFPSLPEENIKIEGNSVSLTMESGETVEFPYPEPKSKSTVYRNKTRKERNKHRSVLPSASSLRNRNNTLRLRTAKFEAVGPEKPKSTTGRMTKTAQKARNTAVAVLVKESRGKTAEEIRGLIAATVGMRINADSAERVNAAVANATAAASTAANTGAAGGAGAGASPMPKGFVMQKSTLNSVIRNAVGKVKPDALNALLADITRQLGSTTLSTRD